MSAEREANAAERQRWNDAGWTTAWLRREPVTAAVTGIVLEHLGLRDGERVLDIGCGAGGVALAAAGRVAPRGAVVGVDLSERLVELANTRAEQAGLSNATFVVGDAQTDTIAGQPFDAATSQFGVMFFADPVQAFANVARQVVAGGRLTFACWQRLEDNPWCVTPTLVPFLAEAPQPTLGGPPPGPFSMGDRARVLALLAASGWESVEWTPYEQSTVVERGALVRDDDQGLTGIAESDRPDAVAAMERQIQPFRTPAGTYEIPLAFQLFDAHGSGRPF
jgi:SAM-dependent methyltransferase